MHCFEQNKAVFSATDMTVLISDSNITAGSYITRYDVIKKVRAIMFQLNTSTPIKLINKFHSGSFLVN